MVSTPLRPEDYAGTRPRQLTIELFALSVIAGCLGPTWFRRGSLSICASSRAATAALVNPVVEHLRANSIVDKAKAALASLSGAFVPAFA